MKKVFVLQGRPSSGKSTTIKALYGALKRYNQTKVNNVVSEIDIKNALSNAADIKETIHLEDFCISLASHGDDYKVLKRILEDMDSKGWDILVCCCHLYNKNNSTHKLIKERYEALNIPIQWEKINLYEDKTNEEIRVANLLLEMILSSR